MNLGYTISLISLKAVRRKVIGLSDPFFRGFLEQYVDVHIDEAEIKNMKGVVDLFGFGIKSKLDAQIGFFLGCSYSEFLMQFLILNNRLPRKDEMLMFFNMMKRRLPEIIKEIKGTHGSNIKDVDEEVTPVSEVEVEQDRPIIQ